MIDGKLVSVAHPGEVWLRYSYDENEPWTKVDLRLAEHVPKSGTYELTYEERAFCRRQYSVARTLKLTRPYSETVLARTLKY